MACEPGSRSGARSAWSFVIALAFVAIVSISGCGGGGGGGSSATSAATPLPTVPVGSVVVTVPSNLPAQATQFRVRALSPGTATDLVSPVVVPVGRDGVSSATLVVSAGTVDVAEEALDSVGQVLSSRKVRIQVVAGALVNLNEVFIPSPRAYVTDRSTAQIYVVNLATGAVDTNVSTSTYHPTAVAFTADGQTAFAIDPAAKRLLLVDVLFNTLSKAISLDGQPKSLVVPSQGGSGFMALQEVSAVADAVQSFSLSDGRILTTQLIKTGVDEGGIAVPGYPSLSALAVTPDGTQLIDAWQPNPVISTQPYVEIRKTSDLSVSSTARLAANTDVRSAQAEVAPGGQVAALSYVGADALGRILVSTLPPGTSAEVTAPAGAWVDLAFSSNSVVLALRNTGHLDVISLAGFPPAVPTIASSIAVGPNPVAVAWSSTTARAYVTCSDGYVWVVNPVAGQVTQKIKVGGNPAGIATYP